jgi:hypothetical protein
MAAFLVRSVIRLGVTVGILVAVYLLIVRPVLDTTDNAINQTFQGNSGIVDQITGSLDDAGVSGLDLNLGSSGEARRLLDCITGANGDAKRIERCANRYGAAG